MPRHAKPLELHASEGTLRSRHKKRSLGNTKLLHCPRDLKGKRRIIWRRIAQVVSDRTVESDREALRLLVDAVYEFEILSEYLHENDMTYQHITTVGHKTPKIRPEVALRKDAWKRLSRLLSKFGLSPSDRVPLGITGKRQLDQIDKRKKKDWL